MGYYKVKMVLDNLEELRKFEEMEADHITPWKDGVKTVAENYQMLCKQDNRTKSGE